MQSETNANPETGVARIDLVRNTGRMTSRVLAFALAWAFCCGCSSDHHADDENPSLSDVVFVGGTTDEALSVMLDATPKDVASERVTFVSPEPSATLSKAAPVAIQFQGAHARLQAPVDERPAQRPSLARRALWDLEQLLKPIGVAHAHGAPFNGTGYFLVFEDAAHQSRLRVFTDQTAYTPDSAGWGAIAAGQQPIKLSVTSAVFEENAVLGDGGPFAAGSIEFSVR
ncbi:MAG TPA: hypothetical protein VFQ35_15440 [Polyangiaceae bacterium]|nr:hypothetical protein [Polyangiaceae bacterium]